MQELRQVILTRRLTASEKFLRARCARTRVKPGLDEILFEVIFILLMICGCSTHQERASLLPPDRAIPDVALAVRLSIQSPPFVALGQIARLSLPPFGGHPSRREN